MFCYVQDNKNNKNNKNNKITKITKIIKITKKTINKNNTTFKCAFPNRVFGLYILLICTTDLTTAATTPASWWWQTHSKLQRSHASVTHQSPACVMLSSPFGVPSVLCITFGTSFGDLGRRSDFPFVLEHPQGGKVEVFGYLYCTKPLLRKYKSLSI